MRPSNWIKRYIAALKDGDVFTTRCFMGFGSRAAIDQCLYRMVKDGRIIRLARGVFAKNEVPATITLYDLAKIKAQAFGKSIYEHGTTAAAEMGLLEKPEPVFATDGCTSSFGTFLGRIHVKSVSAKKRDFGTPGSDPLRRTLKGLWYLGKRLCNKGIIQKYLQQFNNRKGDEVLAEEAATLPYWLIEKFPFRPHLAITASQRRNSVAPHKTPAPQPTDKFAAQGSSDNAAQGRDSAPQRLGNGLGDLASPAPETLASPRQDSIAREIDAGREQGPLIAEQITAQPSPTDARIDLIDGSGSERRSEQCQVRCKTSSEIRKDKVV
jgi:hypothetical protein